ncbi:hypothetical protein F4703DRAFT_1797119 [Phycomyces blakesleeanus]
MAIGRPSWLLCINDDRPDTNPCITRSLLSTPPVDAANYQITHKATESDTLRQEVFGKEYKICFIIVFLILLRLSAHIIRSIYQDIFSVTFFKSICRNLLYHNNGFIFLKFDNQDCNLDCKLLIRSALLCTCTNRVD